VATNSVEPGAALYVIFGGTGDLAQRLVLPALYHLHARGEAADIPIVAVTRGETDDAGYRGMITDALVRDGVALKKAAAWARKFLYYQPIHDGTADDYRQLGNRLDEVEAAHKLPGNRVFYLALPPQVFGPTASGLARAGLNRAPGWVRLVVEKPFGRDLDSALKLNKELHKGWREDQIYRMDHFLGKETVQNLMVFRFANAMFESLWNREHISSVQINVPETLGVEKRAGYYESAGVIRDMIQNHLTQILTLVAMEPPSTIEAAAIRQEKVKVLRSIQPIEPDDVVRGQYTAGRIGKRHVPAYRKEPGVAPDSTTSTFVAMKLEIDNWRWQGVPFLLRTGKRMATSLTEIVLTLREPPVSLFQPYDACQMSGDTLVLRLQPDEGFVLYFDVKIPGPGFRLSREPLHFAYGEAFGPLPEAYETLLLDVIQGEQMLFVHADEVEASWRLYTPVLENGGTPLPYPAGSWGPEEANRLAGDGPLRWRNE
jgi:glucose-6-phosphate 1-dehydrogenase